MSPLEPLKLVQETFSTVSQYVELCNQISNLNDQFQLANNGIQQVKRSTSQANLVKLNNQLDLLCVTQRRFLQEVIPLCDTYLRLKHEKERNDNLKVEARKELDEHRVTAFPNFQTAINAYLKRFNTGFEIVNVQPFNAAGRPSSIYQIRINNINVNLSSAQGEPSFRNTLSGGDRNSLALAFFLASIDQEPDITNRVIVLDDVVASLDEHRKLVTAEEVLRLLQRVSQVIVLSHNKSFLCEIWKALHDKDISTLQIVRAPGGSSITTWDPITESLTNHDRFFAILIDYHDNNGGDPRRVAESIRYVLEGYLRAKFPNHFPPGSMLGKFVTLSRQHLGQTTEIINSAKTDELSLLVDYANKYHHETNHNWSMETINDGELRGFVKRTISFIQG
jgi:wobble nucleotide-excising tRNase